ncbi:MAG: hypothetical protein B7X35_03525 [Halothiobacillus sp. 14-56-357]|jgi:hypothetical protein|uniref:hypothetical protein n=1 Tax=Halothiobacillus sp. 15-55-196 TaxID=1970382 RepID=UPI000BD90FFC|nr:hypothetical protein [Halothiobacillus sp. 15-55-196]OZB36497.1 MAG: hypothetical protein B7X44_05650 [Halothiobacillus sp. 15-55-196]OZB56893.1 MAG: hypothetical protein B7X35_03525 [Halothiobacillus sp. 14-56-357]OZB77743.1 MAG: hypothetical protein B7X29_07460 [Halothiobacillus sp. 13-55-115]
MRVSSKWVGGVAGMALCFGMVLPAQAELSAATRAELAPPIVALMPIVLNNEQELGLDAKQKAFLADWAKKMPPRRESIERHIAELRIELRHVLLDGGTRDQRDHLVQQIGAETAHLVMMRSLCVDTLREQLTPEQFKKVVALYRQGQH